MRRHAVLSLSLGLGLGFGCSGAADRNRSDTLPTAEVEADTGAQPSPTAEAEADRAKPRPTAEAEASKEIYIDSVRGSNPITVYGRARTFENTVQVRVRDATGRLIAERFTTSSGEMGHHNPFARELWLTRDPGSRVIAEAFEYSANDGSVRSLTADTVAYRNGSITLHLVYPTSDCTVTSTFTRSAPRTVALARLLVEALVEGPTAAEQSSGARSPFPRGAAVNSVILRGGEITVDFNERLQNVGGACAAQGIRAAVTQTLTRLPAVTSVIITAGGSRDQALQP
jgi:hypothetical protein